jgi:hypothetical protein
MPPERPLSSLVIGGTLPERASTHAYETYKGI